MQVILSNFMKLKKNKKHGNVSIILQLNLSKFELNLEFYEYFWIILTNRNC